MDKRIAEAKKLLESGNLPEARVIVEEVLKEHPSDPAARNLLGLIYFHLEDYNESINIFKDLVEEFPNEVSLLVNLGLAYLKKGDSLEAVRVLEKAVRLNPHHKKAYNYLGLAYANLNLFQKARDAFKLGDSPKMVEKMEQILASLSGEEEEQQQHFEEIAVNQREEELSRDLKLNRVANKDISSEKLNKLLNTLEVLSDGEVQESRFPGIDLDRAAGEGPLKVVENFLYCVVDEGPCYIVTRDILVKTGNVEFKPRYKKYKGKELKSYFSTNYGIINEVTGMTGKLILRPRKKIHHFRIRDDLTFYFYEKLIYAFGGDLKWENGRLPSPGEGEDLYLVQFRGEGDLVIAVEGTICHMGLSEIPLYIPLESFVGWGGDAIPAFIKDPSGNLMVELVGEGVAFLRVE